MLSSSERSTARRSARSGHTVPAVLTSLNKNRAHPVSQSTVRRALVQSRNPLVFGPKKRGRVLSAKNKLARLNFCIDNLSAQCGCWIYVDSKHFYCYKDGAGKAKYGWHDNNTKVDVPSNSNPIHFHVYAGVTKDNKTSLIFTAPSAPMGSKEKHGSEAFSSRHFIQVAKQLQKEIVGWGRGGSRYPVILDHASQHTSYASKAAIQHIGLNLKEGFPAQCWDINIIENVWAVFDNKVRHWPGRTPNTPDGWRRRLRNAWAAVEQSTINKLVNQVKGRMTCIIEKEGAWLFAHYG